MIRRFAVILLLGLNESAAQKVTLALTERGTDAEYIKTMMMANVFEFRGDSVSNPLDFASAKTTDPVTWRKIKSPIMNKAYRKGFTWIFSGVKTDAFSANHTLLLIENPGWTAFNSLVWTDRNHNFDLTDDGAPDTIKPHSRAVIAMDNRPNGYQVMLEHFPASQFKQFAVMNDKAIYQLQGNRLFSGTENSFRIRKMNLLFGTWRSGKEEFAICVKDINCNGKYADDGIDEVMIADDGKTFQNLQSCVLKNRKAYLEWNSSAFYVDDVDAEGQYIKFTRDTTATLKYILNKGKKLPRFRYAEPTSKGKTQKRRIRKFSGEMLYVYVWHDQSAEYIQDSATLHALGRMTEAGIKVLMLNYGASSQYLHRYSKKYETGIFQGYSSNKINIKLKIRKIPTGILLNNKQRIVDASISPSEVIDFLKLSNKVMH